MKTTFLALMTAAASAVALAQTPDAPRESPLEAAGPLAPLHGTLMTRGRAGDPVVLIVPGSGPTDRDGNNPLGVSASTYRLLAHELAARSIDTVRIDKRGLLESAKAVADPNAVTIDDYADDVRSWVTAIRRETAARCVWVLGHSEGGLVALAAGRRDAGICGLILVATPGRKLGVLLREQLAANPANAPLLEQANGAIDALEAGRRVDTGPLHPALAGLFKSKVQGFLINALALDPTVLIKSVDKPILIVQGERDLQVGVTDANLLSRAAPAAKLVLLPNTNHVLKEVATDDRAANLATYRTPDLPLAPGVAVAIAHFIDAVQAHRK